MNNGRDPQLRTLLLFFGMLAIACVWYFIGRYQTLYGLGVLVMIPIAVVGLLVTVLARLIPGLNWRMAANRGMFLTSVLMLILITWHLIDRYKPTYDLVVDESFEGCAYVFTAMPDSIEPPFIVNEHGVGYIPRGGEYQVEMFHGDRDITHAMFHGNSQTLEVYNTDSTIKSAYWIACYDLKLDSSYSETSRSYPYLDCMTPELFKEYIALGWIDEALLHKVVYTRFPGEDNWRIDHDLSRISSED